MKEFKTKFRIRLFVILLIFFSVQSVQSQEKHDEFQKITFKANNVQKSDVLYPTVSYSNALKKLIAEPLEAFPASKNADSIIPVNMNAFVATVHLAFAKHYPLLLTPDQIWLLIIQGLSTQINKNNEIFRHNLVRFNGKQKITFYYTDSEINVRGLQWDKIVDSLCLMTDGKLKKTLYDELVPKFSTTGNIEKTVFEITFLESFKSYFDYEMGIACGIPEITLTGTTEDWKKIRRNAEIIEKFGMKYWAKHLYPVLDQFVNAASGNVDSVFWGNIYRYDKMCGTRIDGWILNFFPISDMGDSLISLDQRIQDVSPISFPSGLSRVPFTVFTIGGSDSLKEKLIGGFVGIRQDPNSLAVTPEIAWVVAKASDLQDSVAYSIEKYENVFINKVPVIDEIPNITDITPLPYSLFLRPDSEKIYLFHDFKIYPPLLNILPGKNFGENVAGLKGQMQDYLKSLRITSKIKISFIVDHMGNIINIQVQSPGLKKSKERKIITKIEKTRILVPAEINSTYVPVSFELEFN